MSERTKDSDDAAAYALRSSPLADEEQPNDTAETSNLKLTLYRAARELRQSVVGGGGRFMGVTDAMHILIMHATPEVLQRARNVLGNRVADVDLRETTRLARLYAEKLLERVREDPTGSYADLSRHQVIELVREAFLEGARKKS
jgi:hypothetical protein